LPSITVSGYQVGHPGFQKYHLYAKTDWRSGKSSNHTVLFIQIWNEKSETTSSVAGTPGI
jgi:hypothetical protein